MLTNFLPAAQNVHDVSVVVPDVCILPVWQGEHERSALADPAELTYAPATHVFQLTHAVPSNVAEA